MLDKRHSFKAESSEENKANHISTMLKKVLYPVSSLCHHPHSQISTNLQKVNFLVLTLCMFFSSSGRCFSIFIRNVWILWILWEKKSILLGKKTVSALNRCNAKILKDTPDGQRKLQQCQPKLFLYRQHSFMSQAGEWVSWLFLSVFSMLWL